MARKPAFDIPTIKLTASGRWAEILSQLARAPLDVLDGRHHPCPKCGGTDRFRFTNIDQGGSAICNHCLTAKNGDGLSVLQWLTGDDFPAALARVADYLGIKPVTPSKPKADPLEYVTPQPWNDILASLWCRSKPPIIPAAVQAFNGRIARWDRHGGFSVIALPIWGPKLDQAAPIGLMLWNLSAGQPLPKSAGKGKPPEYVKMRVTTGSRGGMIMQGLFPPADFSDLTGWKTEGPGDALALWSMIPEADQPNHFIFCNSSGANECPPWIVAQFSGCKINVIGDADQPGEAGAKKWTTALAQVGEVVRRVRLPYEIAETSGKDLRDYFNDGHIFTDLLALAESSLPITQDATPDSIVNEADDDPHRLARIYLDRYGSHPDHGPTLKFWRQEWYPYTGQLHQKIDHKEFRPRVTAAVKEQFNRDHAADILALSREAEKEPVVRRVPQSLISNVVGALEGLTIIPSATKQPSWLAADKSIEMPVVALQNGLLHIDRLLSGKDDFLHPHSPNWFSTICLPFTFNPTAAAPQWNAFLEYNLELDPERIKLVQEWAGYLLTASTDQQKFLILEGEGANGKSVYCAAIEAMLGPENVSHVPLEVFGDRFSKTGTLGKLANIVAECGELDRIAEGYLKSFTSGDTMFFDRKNIQGLNVVPTARMMLATNNLPRFSDRSSGIWRRMILVPWRIAIPKSKRILGMDSVEWWQRSGELPGIFNWAIAGLHRLRQQKQFTESTLCEAALATYQAESNPAGLFITETCKTLEAGRIECRELYNVYKKWAKDSGYKPLGERMFGREVRRKFPLANRRRLGSRGSQFWVYDGVHFEEPTKETFAT